jgi:hypothetical protein
MRYTRIIPYAQDDEPNVFTEFFEAHSDQEAKQMVVDVAKDAKHLMDATIEDWRQNE